MIRSRCGTSSEWDVMDPKGASHGGGSDRMRTRTRGYDSRHSAIAREPDLSAARVIPNRGCGSLFRHCWSLSRRAGQHGLDSAPRAAARKRWSTRSTTSTSSPRSCQLRSSAQTASPTATASANGLPRSCLTSALKRPAQPSCSTDEAGTILRRACRRDGACARRSPTSSARRSRSRLSRDRAGVMTITLPGDVQAIATVRSARPSGQIAVVQPCRSVWRAGGRATTRPCLAARRGHRRAARHRRRLFHAGEPARAPADEDLREGPRQRSIPRSSADAADCGTGISRAAGSTGRIPCTSCSATSAQNEFLSFGEVNA